MPNRAIRWLRSGFTHRRSMRTRISQSVSSLFIVAVPCAVLASFVLSFFSSRAVLAREGRILAGLVQSGFTQSLWEIDVGRVRSFGETIAREWDVASLIVRDDRDELYRFDISEAVGPLRGSPTTLRLERNGVFVGTVEFSMDYRPAAVLAAQRAVALTLTLLLLLGAILLTLRKAILAELRGPLDEISFLVSSFGTSGETGAPGDALRYVEFDALRDLLVRMGDTIKKQIGELEASLAERDLLMREINHRVKNNLQLLAAIIDQQAEAAGQEKTVLRKLLGRIESLAAVYDQLWGAKRLNGVRMDEYLRDISRLVSIPFRSKAVRIEFSCEPIVFPLDYAIHAGLMAYELVANAAEHAYADSDGAVSVSLKREADDIVLSVEDEGKGCETDFREPPESGLGFRFVAALADQLGAAVEQEGDSGCRFRIRFPAAALDAAAERDRAAP